MKGAPLYSQRWPDFSDELYDHLIYKVPPDLSSAFLFTLVSHYLVSHILNHNLSSGHPGRLWIYGTCHTLS